MYVCSQQGKKQGRTEQVCDRKFVIARNIIVRRRLTVWHSKNGENTEEDMTGRHVFVHNLLQHIACTIILKVLGHGHVFEVWILISSGSDIIIQIRTRGFGVI